MMTGTTILSRSAQAVAGFGILASVLTATGGLTPDDGAAASTTPLAAESSVTVPAALNPPAGQVLVADFAASGVQVYQCTAGAWAFVEPAASLVGRATGATGSPGVRTAVHFRGPSWESTNDGSLVEAKAIANVPVSGSIAQLLLQSTRNRGDGLFGHVGYIQRLATSGGAMPTTTCTDGQTDGVPYWARYRFFAPKS